MDKAILAKLLAFHSETLDDGEVEIALAILGGKTYKSIATEMNFAERTIKRKAVQIYENFGTTSRLDFRSSILMRLLVDMLMSGVRE
ncbi:MAG: LuxR C-terminal-related transcriptional regulator [Eggerthellaceae bacterium]|nr:LuxR C-terminal-related transcriptional regulator [Eggerthellaceae bacterium]